MMQKEVKLSCCVIRKISLSPYHMMDRLVVGLWVIKTCCPHKGRLMAAAALTHSSALQIIHLIKQIILSDDGDSTSVVHAWITHTHTHTHTHIHSYVFVSFLFGNITTL